MRTTTRKRACAAAAAFAALLAITGLAACTAAETSDEEEADEELVELDDVVCTSDYVDASDDDVAAWLEGTVYDVDAQADIAEQLDADKDGATFASPLIVYNPFGTNSQSLYVYFTTAETASVTYTVSVSDEQVATIEDESLAATSIADFTRDVDDGASATEFEFTLYGLIPNVINDVTIVATYEDGTTQTLAFACDMCDVLGDEKLQLEYEDGESDAELSDGLYAMLGSESDTTDFTYLYDNDGILRGEIPIVDGRVHRFIFEDDLMYFCTTKYHIAAMNSIGQIVRMYETDTDGDYQVHHDLISDGEDHLIALITDADSDTIEDLVMFVNQQTGEIDYTIDMGELLADYKEQALAYFAENGTEEDEAGYGTEEGVDWLHINGLAWMGDDSLLLSCREVSTIIKVSDVYGTPTLEYFISSEEYWEDTVYEDYVYEKVGDFTVQGGQHCIEYIEDDSLDDGQYYVTMYNNNIGINTSTTSDFDYTSIGLTSGTKTSDDDDVYSYYYKYLVDENAGTFELVDSIAVPYSGYISSAQDTGSTVVTASGVLNIFEEYDEDGVLIRSFTMDLGRILYRVIKYDL